MSNKVENRILFNSNACLTQATIASYIEGSLSKSEVLLVKEHSSKCELCSDTLVGASHFSTAHSFNLRIEQMHQSKWRRSLNCGSRARKLYYGISSIAASLIVLLGVFFILRMDKVIKKEFEMLPEIAQSVPIDSNSRAYDESIEFRELETEAYKPVKMPVSKKEQVAAPQVLVNDIVLEPEIESFYFEEEIVLAEVSLDVEEAPEMEYILEENLDATERTVALESEMELLPEQVSMRADNDEIVEEEGAKKEKVRKKRASKSTANESYYIAEVMPMFQGGSQSNFNKFLADSLKTIIPDSALVESIVVSFIVDTAGNVNKVKLITGTSSEVLNMLIVDFIETSPVWIPAYQNGIPVEIEQQIEIVLDTLININ